MLLFASNPGHRPESSRDLGDRTTLPLGVLTSKQYMQMQTEVRSCVKSVKSVRVMAGMPSEAAASSFCSGIPFSEMIWLSLSRTKKSVATHLSSPGECLPGVGSSLNLPSDWVQRISNCSS